MDQIVKVIFDDGTELVPDYELTKKPLSTYTVDPDHRIKYIRWKLQYRPFEKTILENLDEAVIKQYAKEQLDLIDEDDADIKKFNNAQILIEAVRRELISDFEPSLIPQTILEEDHYERMMVLLKTKSPIEIENILKQIENGIYN